MITVTGHASYTVPATHDLVPDTDAIVAHAERAARAAFPNARAVAAYDIDLPGEAHDVELEVVHEFTPEFATELGRLRLAGRSDAGAYELDPLQIAFKRG